MSYNYRFAKLGDFASFKNGINYRRLDTGEKIRIINVKELVSIDFVDDMTDLPIIELEYDKYKNYLIKEDNIIIARSASPGEVILYKGSKPTIYSGFSIKIDFDSNILYPEFLFYYLKFYKSKVINVSNGTIFKNLNQNILNNIEIPIMSYSLQQAIANILSSLDDKIELNNKINKNLEELAQTLYKQWFVDFEFPNEDGLPYKSSGGEMVDSELGLIPIGWKVKNQGEYFPVVTGKKNANFATEDGKYKFFTCSKSVFQSPSYSFEGTAILVAGNGDFNVKYYKGKFEAYQRTYVLIPTNKNFAGLLYFMIKENLNKITSGHRGSVIKFITKGDLESYKIVLPNDDVLEKNSKVFEDLINKLEHNKKQNEKLINLRDLLLPKLMSGEIRVPIKE